MDAEIRFTPTFPEHSPAELAMAIDWPRTLLPHHHFFLGGSHALQLSMISDSVRAEFRRDSHHSGITKQIKHNHHPYWSTP
jgi:hypothetical protein